VLVLRQGKGPWVYAVVHDYVGPSRPTYQLASMETLCLLLMVSVFENTSHTRCPNALWHRTKPIIDAATALRCRARCRPTPSCLSILNEVA
jgi:hypothetical protein